MAIHNWLVFHLRIDDSPTFADWRKTCFQCHSLGGRSSFGGHQNSLEAFSARFSYITLGPSLQAVSSALHFASVYPAQVSSRKVASIG